ncbi:MAG TPA: AAA family ATPase, partial [Bacillales bacterium]|nr:AAA family ATPase [Bacillales bacterium]
MEAIQDSFRTKGYITDQETAVALRLLMELEKPLLVEGPAGVGKTEIAKVLADVLNTRLIRLQCYEGLDANMALYEWNYPKQMLHIRLTENQDESVTEKEE